VKILLELRPAFEGHAGIPQETRLLFRGLQQLEELKVDGMLQTSSRLLAKGLPSEPDKRKHWPTHKQMNRLSRVVVSAQPGRGPTWLERIRAAIKFAGSLLGRAGLSAFDPAAFRDFVWRSLFAKTLPASDFDVVTRAGYRVLQLPWNGMHYGALGMRRLVGRAWYPRLDTRDYDVLIAETPFPGRVSGSTQLVVRYHDAIPILMPHSIVDREHHQASHYQALRRNVEDGAWFACVSESTRSELLRVFPEAKERAVTLPNMVSHHYFREESSRARVPDILYTRRNAAIDGASGQPPRPRPYLLMVSTIEPRKNHLALLSAWEALRTAGHPELDLVFVGALGWEHKPIVRKFLPWLAQGRLHVLEDVPAGELRLLYRHAEVTVCPSFCEGFDFSGIEAMRCGGVVAASDIGVHRDVFADAAEYFTPYATEELVRALNTLLKSPQRCDELRVRGDVVSAQYLPERLLPQWQAFFQRLAQTSRAPATSIPCEA
jgi:glycosyltransferase involved in cell wall biosynthesis